MAKRHNRAVYSYLVVLMTHIIKWISQPNKKTSSWQASIKNSKEEIEKLRGKNPSISDSEILEKWDKAFKEATETAEEEMGIKSNIDNLSWEQVFKIKYILPVILVLIIVGIIYL